MQSTPHLRSLTLEQEVVQGSVLPDCLGLLIMPADGQGLLQEAECHALWGRAEREPLLADSKSSQCPPPQAIPMCACLNLACLHSRTADPLFASQSAPSLEAPAKPATPQ